MNVRFREVIWTGVLLWLSAPVLVAQQDSDFYNPPQNARDSWNALKIEYRLGKFEVAAEHVRALVTKFKPTDQELLEFENEIGIQAFLRLRTVPKWSDKPEVDKEARDNVEKLIAAVSGALKAKYGNPKTIEYYAKRLTGAPEEQVYAISELRKSGADAIPVLIAMLQADPTEEQELAIYEALPRLDTVTVPPLLAVLADEPKLRLPLLDALDRRLDLADLRRNLDSDIAPLLWYFANPAESNPEPLRTRALRMLTKLKLGLPQNKRPEEELNRFVEACYRHQVSFSSPLVWKYQDRILSGTPTTVVAAEEYFGLRFAKWALEIRPNFPPTEVLFVSLAIDKAMERSSGKLPFLAEAAPDLYKILAGAPSELLVSALNKAINERQSRVVLGLVQVLSDRMDPAMARPRTTGYTSTGKPIETPPPLVRALYYADDPRVRQAAAEALLRIPMIPQHGQTSRIVETLRRALTNDPEEAPQKSVKVLIGDRNRPRGEQLAVRVRRAGYQAEVVETGKEMLRRLSAKEDVDVLFLSDTLAYPPLPEILGQLRADARWGHLPTLVYTSNVNIEQPPEIDTVMLRLAVLVSQLDKGRIDLPPANQEEARLLVMRQILNRRVNAMLGYVTAKGETKVTDLAVDQPLMMKVEYLIYTLFEIQVAPLEPTLKERLNVLRDYVLKHPKPLFANLQPRLVNLTQSLATAEALLTAEQAATLEKTLRIIYEREPIYATVRKIQFAELDSPAAPLIRNERQIRLIFEPFTDEAVQQEIATSFAQAAPPLSPEERQFNAARAIFWLRKIAAGELPGYDARLVGVDSVYEAVRSASRSDALVVDAIGALSALARVDAQQELANLVLNPNRKIEHRRLAAQGLARHLQMTGSKLPANQVSALEQLAQAPGDAELGRLTTVIVGIARPNRASFDNRLRGYVPSAAPQVPMAPMPKAPEGTDTNN